MKTLALLMSAAILTLSVSACSNTFHGVGQDIEKAGTKIQKATK
ncbi:MAG: entericidin A/B family lipoprotein [Pseudomonadota bacterium]|nr:entericidin A/B family lipoprotein [Alphaproteobacteria bacterium]MEC7576480.1 entericidin A/B family lipoprotein [Pseudomonadota bacterium]MEC7702573.1 entericidin A/B family lipoprotein [Pseudomonadota bacterium]MEC9234886.1 entericidin A/B family lipoprotein [Pseudomonadota bacterium]